jgi:2-polyprenyl-6-methoxyphenol hydroxylase-like FAD-dependent oxidoreductase
LGDQDRVLIIGAGPAGKTAAVALRRVGIKFDIYDRVPEFRLLGVGFGLQSNAMRGLIKLGIGSRVVDRAGVGESWEMCSLDGKVLAVMPVGELSRETGMPSMTVLRRDYEELLLREIDPDTLHLGHECVAVEQDPEGVTAHFANGTSAHGTMLIGADGLHSAVRRYLVGETAVRYSGFTAWRGCVDVDDYPIPRNVLRMWLGGGIQAALFPLSGSKVAWAILTTAPQGETDPPGGHVVAAVNAAKRVPAEFTDCVRATDERDIVRGDIFDRDPITKWTTGRVVLMGDAAHPTTPFLGQGLGLCIEDAVVLAKELALTNRLADHGVIPLALKSYERSRIDRATQIVLSSRQRAEEVRDTNRAKRAVRQRVMQMMPASKWRKVLDESGAYEV